jgi:hypothetical protein
VAKRMPTTNVAAVGPRKGGGKKAAGEGEE